MGRGDRSDHKFGNTPLKLHLEQRAATPLERVACCISQTVSSASSEAGVHREVLPDI